MKRIDQAQRAQLEAQQARHELELARQQFEYERQLAERTAEERLARQEVATHALAAGSTAAATVLVATTVLDAQPPETRRTAQALMSLGGSAAVALGACAERGSLARTLFYAVGLSTLGVSIYDYFHQLIRGPLGGIGVTPQERADALVIHWIHPNTAAAAAGLLAGDEIVGVDGLSIAQIGVREAWRRLHGPVGTQVQIVLRRTTTTNTYQWAATLIRTPT